MPLTVAMRKTMLRRKVMRLRATVPMMKPTAEANMVFPNPMGWVLFFWVGVVSMMIIAYLYRCLKMQIY